MQADPRYDDVASEVAAFLEERLGVRRRGRASRRSASASTPASASARPPAQNFELVRRLDVLARARAPGADRALAQELARTSLRPGGDAPARLRRRSAQRWPRTSAARRSSACTTSASTSRRSRRQGRSRDRSSCTGFELHGFHGALDWERERGPELPLRRRARGGGGRQLRQARGRRRLPGRRGLRRRGLGRACVPPARGARDRGRRRAGRALPGRARSVRVRKPDVVLDPPVEFAAVRATRP